MEIVKNHNVILLSIDNSIFAARKLDKLINFKMIYILMLIVFVLGYIAIALSTH